MDRGGVELDRSLRELALVRGRGFWEGLERLAASESFQAFLLREFPSQEMRFGPETERRDFLRLMGASLAFAGLGSCTRQPDERILPYASAPESTLPGKELFFATAFALGGPALGLLVESHEGRPTKIEGNPDHPASLGATDAFAQAAILSLYDPDRSRVVLRAGQIDTWDRFLTELAGRRAALEGTSGEGLAILTPSVVSPTLAAQLAALLEAWPRARWHSYQPIHRDGERGGAELAFGRDVATRCFFEHARVVLALDADFLAAGPAPVRYANDLAARRRRLALQVRGEASGEPIAPARVYAVESSVTITGAFADHRLAVQPAQVEIFARALARELGVEVDAGEGLDERGTRWLRAVLADLRAGEGDTLVLPGIWQSPAVHALAHAINAKLGNVGSTVEYREPIEADGGGSVESLRALVAEMRAGGVTQLVMLGGNPVYEAPADLEFADALVNVPFRVHLSLHEDETSRLCHWHLPEAHFLESWSDARTFDGSASVVQPLIAPLYDGKSVHEVVAALAGRTGVTGHGLVREHWRARFGSERTAADGDRYWREGLHAGIFRDSAPPPLEVRVRERLDLGPAPQSGGWQLAIRPDGCVFDGRFANNGWLQETPRPITRLTWDNAAWIAPQAAERLALSNGDVVELALEDRRLRAPVWIVPGHPDEVVTVHLGYGRTAAGRVGDGVGFDVGALRTSSAQWNARGLTIDKTNGKHQLVSVQDHRSMEGRDIVRVATHDEPAHEIEGAAAHHAEPPSLYPEMLPAGGHAWGMVIDLGACIGCNACMVACQAENNVPIVGKSEVANGREMHWLRVDVYVEEGDAPAIHHQPVPCMHCEHAPCELVCPVGATVHSPEGLNEMVYNRCVGTRYCSNNCPYKVRRFNFFRYADYETEVLKLGRNPDVTVRSRGVMEKCTYCVQRINRAKIDATKEGRALAAFEPRTACQQACPTRAIEFGDLHDSNSMVSRLRREPHHYALLAELGTRPRTTYLARLRNPNPELGGASSR